MWCSQSHPACAAAADVGREAVKRAPADQEEDEGDEEEKEELCEEEPAWPRDHLRIPHRRWPPLQLQQWGVHRPQVRSNLKTLISKYSLLSRSDRGKRLSLDSGVSLGCPGLSLAWEVKNTIWDEISTALKTGRTVFTVTLLTLLVGPGSAWLERRANHSKLTHWDYSVWKLLPKSHHTKLTRWQSDSQ